MVSNKARSIAIGLILIVILLIIAGLYTNTLNPSEVTGLATVLLVLVTIVYTINTREQARATRASYAPSIDLRVYPKADHLAFDITNRGEGVARNIILRVQVGEYEYHGHVPDSLSPGERLYSPYGSENDRVAVVPRFYEPRIERRDTDRTPPRRALKQGKDSPIQSMTDIHGSAQFTLPELFEVKREILDEWMTRNGEVFIPFNIDVTYTDVTETNDFVTESPDFGDIVIKAQSGNLHSILTGDKGVTAIESRWHKFKRKHFDGRDIAPYKETLNTSVQRRIPSLPKEDSS